LYLKYCRYEQIWNQEVSQRFDFDTNFDG